MNSNAYERLVFTKSPVTTKRSGFSASAISEAARALRMAVSVLTCTSDSTAMRKPSASHLGSVNVWRSKTRWWADTSA